MDSQKSEKRYSLRTKATPKAHFGIEDWCDPEEEEFGRWAHKKENRTTGDEKSTCFEDLAVMNEEFSRSPSVETNTTSKSHSDKEEDCEPNSLAMEVDDSEEDADTDMLPAERTSERYSFRAKVAPRTYFDVEGWHAPEESPSKPTRSKPNTRTNKRTMASSSGGPEAKDVIICINCRQQIQLKLHVKCCECPAMICAECFSYGCEAGQHLRGHNYEIRDPLGGRTFDVKDSWGAIEERKLLAAAYRFKLGNWGEVTRLMETDRPISEVQEYYDRFFIRGPIGQLALKLLNWEDTKRAMIADGSIGYQCETDRITYMLMAMDAYKESKEKLDPSDEDLTNKIDAILQNYLFRLSLNDDRPQCSEQSDMSELVDIALSDDSCDPSDYETDKKAPDDAYSTGLEPENDSEEDDVNIISSTKSNKNEAKPLRKSSLRPSVVFMRPSKRKIRCGLRKSTLEKNGRASRYRRVQTESSSTDEDSGSEDEVEPMETDQNSVDDTQDSLHGLEKEDSTDDYTASDSEEAKQEPVKQSATPSNSVKRRRRAKFVSKKARRLKEFQKRMVRTTKAAERRLHELSELCPIETIRELRDSKPNLALYTNDHVGRSKVRQSDMDMLAYNAARGDFEWEWYNDAEQLISRLMIQESNEKIEDLENDIKFARIEKYYRILKTRKAYRRAILEHDKISEFFRFMMNMTMEKRKASQILSQRPPLEKLLTRAQQCLTKKETEDLRSHVERADELMERIAKLQELQRNGVLTLKEAVFLLIALCWIRFLMDSLPSLLFLSTIVELYCLTVLSSSILLKKVLKCFRRRGTHSKQCVASCALESKIEAAVYMEEVVVDNVEKRLRSPMLNLKLRYSPSGVPNFLRYFRHHEYVISHHNGGVVDGTQQGSSSDMSSASQSSGNYPVNVDAVLGANTVEDIADTHPDFARLLLDCYSAGCDLEEYKREFQRLKNLRIKRQGGVNQTLSFSLFPSVPSDLPGHLFVRLLKFHSLYEGACRKYLTDVVNRRAEASPGFPYDLSTIGIQDLVQGSASTEYFGSGVGTQSLSGSYIGADIHFVEPSDVSTSSDVTYSPAMNNAYSQRVPQQSVGMRIDQSMTVMDSMESTTCMQRGALNQMHQHIGTSSFLDRRMTATPLPSWSQSNTASEMRSRMATPLPPLEIRQCPVLQSGLSTPILPAENRHMPTPASHLQSRHLTTPIPGMEGQSYSGMSTPHSQQYQQINICSDGRRMMTATPMAGSIDSSTQNQSPPFATPTKKARIRRKPGVAPQTQIQGHHSMALQGRQMTATPIPGWQQHQASKSNLGMQGQSLHVQNRSMMSASVTPLQRQLTTPVPDHREMMSATPLPGWAPHQVGNGGNQVERSPLVSSLPPLSQFTPIQQPQVRQMKTPYPSMQSRLLTTPIAHDQPLTYEQSSHVYPQSRDMMTSTPFAQSDSVPFAQAQNMGTQMGSATGEVYAQQNVPYQWSEGSSINVYGQQGQFVQQSSYGQQSQFSQQMNTGSQQQVSFVANQSVQYPTPQHPQYPQSVEVQKASAFSQPYNFVQQAYSVPSGFQQQSSYSQDSNFTQTSYAQHSPYAQQQPQQTKQSQQHQQQQQQSQSSLQQHLSHPARQQHQQQQQQHHQQHLHQQQQPVRRQAYENSAQFAAQYSQLIPTYTTQPACGIQSAQHTPGAMQAHQMPTSCEVAGAVLSQHTSDIAHQEQQTTSNFTPGMLDMSGSSATGAIVDILQSNDAQASGEDLDAVQSDYPGMVSSSIPGAPMIDTMIEGQLRTFDITQCPPPPRNDSEATVPARTSPNSCSPGLIVGDDESSSLIPSFFYPKDFTQNDLTDLRIEDSPAEKGLNCQHFRFDIILAMKHHRIGKEDYERTLYELDQMEKEKCVGSLGDLLMKRLGLKRQEQYCHDGKFSVDELVAAFAANAKIEESSSKLPERRMSSELFSEFLEDITAVPSNASTVQFHTKLHPSLHSVSPIATPTSKSNTLQSSDAVNDLGYLLSSNVITEFDSMSIPTTTTVPKLSSIVATASFARSEPLSVCCSSGGKETFNEAVVSSERNSLFTPASDKETFMETPLSDDSKVIPPPSSSFGTSLSFGQPAVLARRPVAPSDVVIQKSSADEPHPNIQQDSIYSPQPQKGKFSSIIKVNSVFTGKVVPKKPPPESDLILKKSLEAGAPAQAACRSDSFSNEGYSNLSPFVISPEPLSDEAEWWRRDDETPPMVEGRAVNISSNTINQRLQILEKSLEEPKPCGGFNVEPGSAVKLDSSLKVDAVKHEKDTSERLKNRKTEKERSHSSESPPLSRSILLKTSDGEEDDQSCCKFKGVEHVKKPQRRTNRTLFGSNSSSDDSVKDDSNMAPSTSRAYHSASFPSLPLVSRKKSHSPHDRHSPRLGKKKNRKSSLPSRPLKECRELPPKSGLSKVELSREVLAKQIAEIIEDERSKLPPEEAKFHKRPLSPASLDVVIQDLMQHHISEDTSPNRELFASKLLGTDIFSKLFFRAGKCVFRHYEELDDFRSKEKGRGRRKGAASRKRDTELLRGIRKSREIQKYKDALRAAKEPSEAEKKAAAERAKLEAMPWLARSTFKPDVQQGSSSRFVIPKKSSGNRSGGEGARATCETKQREPTHQDEADVKSVYQKHDQSFTEYFKAGSSTEKANIDRRPRAHDERIVRLPAEPLITRKTEEISVCLSFCSAPKSSACKARAKHTWPLKRWRSASAVIEEAVEVCPESTLDGHAEDDSVFDDVMEDVDIAIDSFAEVRFEKPSTALESSQEFQTTSFVSARESELAALALQEEMSRSEQASPDDQYDALRYLAAMPESEFSSHADSYASPSSVQDQKKSTGPKDRSAVMKIPPKVFPSEQSEKAQFEPVNWIRMEPVATPFYSSDFDSEHWGLPMSSADSVVQKHPTESLPNPNALPATNSLYSSLQEELDTIVRDTLGDTLYSPTTVDSTVSTTVVPIVQNFEWPKADVPVRSYAPDVILPPLMCGKSRIAVLDMCRCQRCTTRCEYFCNHDEWKYLYDCAISRRREREQVELHHLAPTNQVCSETFEFLNDSKVKHTEGSWKVLQHIADYSHLSVTKIPSVLCEFSKHTVHRSVEDCRWVYQHASASHEFSAVFSGRELKRPPCLESADVFRVELQFCYGRDYFSTFASPAVVVLRCEHESQESAQAIMPIYQVLQKKTSMSVLSTAVSIELQKPEPILEQQVSVPIPRTEVSGTEFVDVDLSCTHMLDDAFAARAITINVPRTTCAVLAVSSLNIAFNTMQRIVEKTSSASEISLPLPQLNVTVLNSRHYNFERKRTDSLLSTNIKLPVPRVKRTSLAYRQLDEHFSKAGTSVDAEISVPLPIFDATYYKSSHLRVRRKRLGTSACIAVTFPIPRLNTSILNIYELEADQIREEPESTAEFSVPLPREDSIVLNITEWNVYRCRQGFSDSRMGAIPLPRMEYTALNSFELCVRRNRISFTASSDVVISVPRLDVIAFSTTETEVAHVREDSCECFEKVFYIARENSTILQSFTLRVKRTKKPIIGPLIYSRSIANEENVKLSICELNAFRERASDTNILTYAHPIPNAFRTSCAITAQDFDVINREVYIFNSNKVVDIPAEEHTSTNIIDMNVFRLRRDQSSLVREVKNYSDSDQYALATLTKVESFSHELAVDDLNKSSSTVVPIPCEDVEVLRLSTVRMSRKRKHEEESVILVKRLKIEDQAGLFITEKSFRSANRITEVIYIKDPRLPLQCSNSFVEVSKKWRYFAHQHMPHLLFSSYLVTQFATLLQRVFSGGVDQCTITMKDLKQLIENVDGRYDLDIFTNPAKVQTALSDPSGPVWERLMKLRMQRNSTELLSRKALAPLYIFLGMSNLPRVGKPWRKWLKPIDAATESRIGWQLALCMRIPDLVGVDDMDPKLQAVKMWWTVMMIRGTVPWYIYPCFSRRQLFVLVRLLEALEGVDRPPFCLYPPKAFFKAVKKILRHPRTDLIPKDIYHPDITTMATLLRMKRNRVFHVDRSLPELLSHWLDDMNKIDAYLADDVKLKAISPSDFLTQSEWAWKNFGQGCIPDGINYDRNVNLENTLGKLTECLANFNIPLEQRKKISVLKTALSAWSKYDSGPSVDQIPVDIINPFALSASLIALLPMPEGFIDECFTFLEKVSKKSSQQRQNPVKRNTKSSPNWKWKPGERLASVGKPISDGTKANGKTTINTLFEEFWQSPKDFSTISVFNKEENVALNSNNFEKIGNAGKSADKYICALSGYPRKQNTMEAHVVQQESIWVTSNLYDLGQSSAKKATTERNDHLSKVPPVKEKAKTSTTKNEKEARPNKRWRKRKESMIDEAKSLSEVMRPFKKSKIEMRKRRQAKTSDEDGPTCAKQPMAKIPEYRLLKLRHTLARRGMETEKMVHETVLRAAAIAAAKGPDTPIPSRRSEKRHVNRDSLTSDNSDVSVVRNAMPGHVKRRRPATIFDVTNFEWVLEMSLRRPRAFVGLYKTMKCQYRVLEKRRWVEKNRKMFDRAQFEKFLKEASHTEVEMIEKTKLLKAEKDMELALGVKRVEAERMEKFAIKDLAHWYGMSARYAIEADALARKTLEEAKLLDVAMEELRKQEADVDEGRQNTAKDIVTHNAISATLKSIVEKLEATELHEIEKGRAEVLTVKKTLMDIISQVEQDAQDGVQDHPMSEISETLSLSSLEFDADASNTATVISMSFDNSLVNSDQMEYDVMQENAFRGTICVKSLEKEITKISDKLVPPVIHMRSCIPITSAYISVILTMNIPFKLQIPFEPRFKRPRRIDRELDLLPPGDFSPYSTDEEWEEFYEKKERFENHHPMAHQQSWSSYGYHGDGDDECLSGLLGHQQCDCALALNRVKEWISGLTNALIRRCYSEEVLPKCCNVHQYTGHPILMRCSSALSCVSMERLPILELPDSATKPAVELAVFEEQNRWSSSSSLPLISKPRSSSRERSASVPPSWRPSVHHGANKLSLCDTRRDRNMYPRALSGCRYHVYGASELRGAERRRCRRRGYRPVHSRAQRESDIPHQWIKRGLHRYDFLKSVRFWLDDRAQRSIPVLWYARHDEGESYMSQGEADEVEQDTENIQVVPVEHRECPLEYPIAIYNPPPTWDVLTERSQSEKRVECPSTGLEHSSSEPSAFQPVLQRPQPIDLNALDVEVGEGEESEDKIPKWPLLKKLREAERELLAAGNPIAVERQKIREYNRQLRSEMMHEQDEVEEQLRQMHQLYLEYFAAQQLILAQVLSTSWIQFTQEQQGLLETMEQQHELDQRWYSLLREEQQLTRRRTRDAVLTDMLFLRPESSYETEHHSYFDNKATVLSNELTHGFQGNDGEQEAIHRPAVKHPLSGEKGSSDPCSAVNEGEGLIEVLDVEPDEQDRVMQGRTPSGTAQENVTVQLNEPERVPELATSISSDEMRADANVDVERRPMESTVGTGLSSPATSSPIVVVTSSYDQTGTP